MTKHIHIYLPAKTRDEVKHAPAGSSKGGQFVSGSGGQGGSAPAKKSAPETFAVAGKLVKRKRAPVLYQGKEIGEVHNYMGTVEKKDAAGKVAHSRKEVVMWGIKHPGSNHTSMGYRSLGEAEDRLRYIHKNHSPKKD